MPFSSRSSRDSASPSALRSSCSARAANPPRAADSTATPVASDLDGGSVGAPDRRRKVVLALVVCGAVMDQLDTTIVNVAGPAVRSDIGGGAGTIQWLVAGYTLAFAVLLITGGRLGDLYGRRRMFLVGAVGFTAASIGCGVAGSPAALIVARVIQGSFGALLIPQGLGILKAVFPPKELNGAYGAFAPAIGLASVAGPTLAGVLIGLDLFGLGWRTVFLINVPLALAVIAGAVRFLPRDEDTGGPDAGIDLAGTALLTVASLLVIYPIVQGRAAGWPAWTLVMLAAGLLSFGGFVAYERVTSRLPVVEPSLLRDRTFTSGLIVAVVFFGAIAGVLLALNLFTQTVLGFSALHAGLTGLPLSVGIAIAAARSRALTDRFGRRVLHGGLALMTLGLLVLAATVAHQGLSTTTWELIPATLLSGAGMGFVFGPLFATILSGVGAHEVGSASGTLSAVQQLGGALGVAALTTLFFSVADGASNSSAAMTVTSLVSAGATGCAYLLVFLLPRHPHTRAGDAPAR